MASLFASMAVKWALDTLSSLLPESAPSQRHRRAAVQGQEDLRRLQRTMNRIDAALRDAENKWDIRDEVTKLWLAELKQVAYDARDVVEKYEYEVARRKVWALERAKEGGDKSHKRKRHQVNAVHPSSDAAALPIPSDLAASARNIRERFDEIIKDFGDLRLFDSDGERRFDPDIHTVRHTCSFVFEPSIVGREHDKQSVIEMLLSGGTANTSHVSVLPIVGMGGVGKTTLAQLVYNDPQVRQAFEQHAWVCVSDHFDIENITSDIITSLVDEWSDITGFVNLQSALINKIDKKRILLVLDDVWNEHLDWWQSFCTPLFAASVCKIIVTTRHKEVARIVQTMPVYDLTCLSAEHSWSLFRQIAFEGQENILQIDLLSIGKSVVEKCKGLPLAIRTLGSMLRYERNEEKWSEVLENELWDLEKAQSGIMPALKLSFKHMPVYLKRCFIALSLFPKEYALHKDEVIFLWRSLGLLQSNGRNDPDHIGNLYLSELVQRSILEYNGNLYTMHDLTNDLARTVAGKEFLRLEDDKPVDIPQDVRCLSIIPPYNGKIRRDQILNGSVYLRVILVTSKVHDDIEIPDEFFANFPQLRTIILQGAIITKALLDSVGNLKQLQHLRIVSSKIVLYRSISLSRLYNLRTLDLRDNLSSFMLNGIEHLINLQTIPVITNWGCACHSNINELANLNNIRGTLVIRGLGNLSSIGYAEEANLHCKNKLQALVLVFSQEYHVQDCIYERSAEPVADICQDTFLECLRPHYGLRELVINSYKGRNCPSWLGDPSFSLLTKLTLYDCAFDRLPTLGQLPSLKHVDICNMDLLETIGREFCRPDPIVKGSEPLVHLSFYKSTKCLEWSAVGEGDFPSLVGMELAECPSLTGIPTLSLLRKLSIELCDSLSEVPSFPALCELSICHCANIVGLHNLPLLQKLTLTQLPSLTSFVHLPSVTSIQLNGAFRYQLVLDLFCSHLSLGEAFVISDTVSWI